MLWALSDWLDAGRTAFLCTIVETYGSSPRPAGSMLALNDDFGLVGSLSGGCIEDDLVEGLRDGRISVDRPTLMTFGIAAEDVERLGLPCGGTLAIMVECFDAAERDRAHVRELLATIRGRRVATRVVAEGAPDSRQLVAPDDHPRVELQTSSSGVRTMRHTLGPSVHLFIIGAGMVSQYLAQIALTLDYEVTVCEPRDSIRAQWTVPDTVCVGGMPDDAIRSRANDARTAIVALTHDPRIDDMGLAEALESSAFYVGAMGSAKSSESRRQRLSQLGLTLQALDRLHAPIGLPIGSKTPAAIAVSIMAQLIQARSRFAEKQPSA